MDIEFPNVGENIDSALVLSVLVKAGDEVAIDQSIIEVETDKATLEVPSPVAGTIDSVTVKDGDTVKVGQVIATAKESSGAVKAETKKTSEKKPEQKTEKKSEPKKAAAPQKTAPAQTEAQDGQVLAGPAVRYLAREIGVEISQVPGSGPKGLVSMIDLKKFARESRGQQSGGAMASAPSLPDFSQWGDVSQEDMSNMRFRTASHMSASWNTIPHVTLTEKADATDLESKRQKYKKSVGAAGGKLTVTSILIKIAAAALKVHPYVSASVDVANRQVINKFYSHIGVAVDTPRGLVVPVIRDVDQKNITELSVELNELAQKARDNKLKPNDMSGAVMTISNLGGFGTGFFTPIVSYPEAVILGVGRSVIEAAYNEETKSFDPRLMLPLSLSFDHRVVDGVGGAKFLHWIASAVADPLLLSLEG